MREPHEKAGPGPGVADARAALLRDGAGGPAYTGRAASLCAPRPAMEHGPAHWMLLSVALALGAGVALLAAARRLQISAIVLLLLGGVALGPEGLNVVRPAALGNALGVIVSLAVALILFEGGLTLDLKGYRSASGVIRRLLSVGVLVTWLATALAVYLVFGVLAGRDLTPAFCLLCGSLVIVTGPTVVAPLLKRIRVTQRMHGILHWEGVLVDPVGVFVAVLCWEWISMDSGGEALARFATRFGAGGAIGIVGGLLLAAALRRRIVPDDMENIAALGGAMVIFGVAEAFESEAGLLAVTAAGFVVGARAGRRLQRLREFKAEITELMIGLLFVLLAARLEFADFTEFGGYGALLVAIVVLVVRPLAVLASSAGQGLCWQEKAFLSWVAPRGIVAASMASLVGLRLARHDDPEGGKLVESFVYSVIAATVLLQGFTAGHVARLLGLRRPEERGWLIVGAHPFARRVARFVRDRGKVPVLLVDSNARLIAISRERGLPALAANALDVEEVAADGAFLGVGNVLALTDNEELNALLCTRWTEVVGREHVYRWTSRAGMRRQGVNAPGRVLWPDLPSPSVLSIELDRGDSRTFAATDPPEGDGIVTPLLVAEEGRVREADGGAAREGEVVLRIRRAGDYLARRLPKELVFRVAATDRATLLASLVEEACKASPTLPREALARGLDDRDMLLGGLVGGGIAMTHVTLPNVATNTVALAQLAEPLDLGAPDHVPIRLVFLIVSPAGDPDGHLATVAEVARIVAADSLRARLLGARTPEELVTRLREIDETPLPGREPRGAGGR